MLLIDHLDFQKLQAQNMVIHPLTTAPGSPVEGQIYYNSSAGEKHPYIHNGTAFRKIAIGPTAAVTDSHIAVFDGVSGAYLKSSGVAVHAAVTVSDTNSIDLTLATQLISADLIYQDSTTIDLSVPDASGLKADAIVQMSITSDASGLKLVNDEASPGNSEYYGTNSGGTKGYHALPSGTVGGSGADDQVAVWSATTTLEGTSNFLFSDTNRTMTLARASDDAVGPILKFSKERITPDEECSAADIFGQISGWFYNNNATPVSEEWARIEFEVVDPADGSEDAEMNFYVAMAGVLTEVLRLDAAGGNLTGGLTISGDLTVNGTTTTVNTATLVVDDPLIKLGEDNDADSVDLGIYWEYSTTPDLYGGIFRDQDDANDAITFFEGNQAEPTTTVNTGGTGYALADVKFGTVRSGTWEGTDVGVAYGGTGASSFTAYSLIAAGTTGTGALSSIVETTQYRILFSGTAAAYPAFSPYTMPATIAQYAMLYASATSSIVALANGATTGTFLRNINGGAPAWSTLVLPNAAAQYGILYASTADNMTVLATTADSVLITNGTGVPSWDTLTGANHLTRIVSVSLGDGDAQFDWVHSLDLATDTDIIVQVWGVNVSTDIQVYPTVTVVDKDTIRFDFGFNVTAGDYKAVLIY